MKKVFNLRIECNAPTFVMTDTEFCQALEEGVSDDFGEEMKYVKLKAETCDKDQRIAELEEQLANSIRPKFNRQEHIYCVAFGEIREFVVVAYLDNNITLCEDTTTSKLEWCDNNFLVLTKEEAEAKLKELEEQDVTNN